LLGPPPNHHRVMAEAPADFTISDIPAHLDDGAWFHGSPRKLDTLAAGSTITRSRPVAEAFSHRPTCLGVVETDSPLSVCHNGSQDGILYVVDEPVSDSDVRVHPKSAFPLLGFEWLANRPLRLRKIADLPLSDPPCQPDCPRRPKSVYQNRLRSAIITTHAPPEAGAGGFDSGSKP